MHPLSIMIVEDHDDSRTATGRLLVLAGHQVQCFDRAGPALDAARLGGFDVAICDIGLPDADGFDLMRTLHDAHGIACIALTGHAADERARTAAQAGVRVHLCKPVNFATLLDAIEHCRPTARRSA